MKGIPVILKLHNLQSLDKALDIFIEFKFCESDFYFLNGSKICMVATYNFGSVYRPRTTLYSLTNITRTGDPISSQTNEVKTIYRHLHYINFIITNRWR